MYESNAVTMLVTLGDLDLGSFEVPLITPPPISPDSYEAPVRGQEVIGAALTALGVEPTPQLISQYQRQAQPSYSGGQLVSGQQSRSSSS